MEFTFILLIDIPKIHKPSQPNRSILYLQITVAFYYCCSFYSSEKIVKVKSPCLANQNILKDTLDFLFYINVNYSTRNWRVNYNLFLFYFKRETCILPIQCWILVSFSSIEFGRNRVCEYLEFVLFSDKRKDISDSMSSHQLPFSNLVLNLSCFHFTISFHLMLMAPSTFLNINRNCNGNTMFSCFKYYSHVVSNECDWLSNSNNSHVLFVWEKIHGWSILPCSCWQWFKWEWL